VLIIDKLSQKNLLSIIYIKNKQVELDNLQELSDIFNPSNLIKYNLNANLSVKLLVTSSPLSTLEPLRKPSTK
jgi:hypothetical protein